MNIEQRTKTIIRLRTQKTPKSLSQIGHQFGLSRERIRQILKENLVNHTKYNMRPTGARVKKVKTHCTDCKKVVLLTPKRLKRLENKNIFCDSSCIARHRERKFKNLLRHGRACLKCEKYKPITAFTVRYFNSEKTRGSVYPSCISCHGKTCYQNHLKLKKKEPEKLRRQQKLSSKRFYEKLKRDPVRLAKYREGDRKRYANPARRTRVRQIQKEYYYRTKLNKKR